MMNHYFVYRKLILYVNFTSIKKRKRKKRKEKKKKTFSNSSSFKKSLLAISFFRILKAMIAQFSSVAQSCPTLCDPMDCSTLGFPVCHQLLQLTQTHIHQVGDAIQPSHTLSSPSPLAFNLPQHQGLFK